MFLKANGLTELSALGEKQKVRPNVRAGYFAIEVGSAK